jgi:hypothetical protein
MVFELLVYLIISACYPACCATAVNTKTVRPVAEGAGSAAAAGLNTTVLTSVFAETVAAAYFTGGVPNQAMNEALIKAAQTAGCRGVLQALARELEVVACQCMHCWRAWLLCCCCCFNLLFIQLVTCVR